MLLSIRLLALRCFGLFCAVILLSHPPAAVGSDTVDPEDDWSEEAESGESVSHALQPGEAEYWVALIAFFESDPETLARGRESLRIAANLEFSPAQNLLGVMHLYGMHGFERNERRAVNWFELAAERGDRFAMVNLAISILERRSFWRRDISRAQELLETALAETGPWYPDLVPPDAYFLARDSMERAHRDPDVYRASMQENSEGIAAYRLGMLLFENKEVEKAHPLFVRAAQIGTGGRGGLYPAAVQAALNLAFGQGVSQDMAKAHQMLEHSKTLLRDQAVDYVVGLIDFNTIDRFAMRSLREQAERTTEEANIDLQLSIARTFGNRNSRDFDAAQAVLWYELAAESGRSWAIIELAQLYSDSTLPIYDLEKAFHWWQYGYEHASHVVPIGNYLICLFHGIGTAPDPDRARALFAQYKDVDIVSHLGSIGHLPSTPLTFEQRIEWIKEWAEKHQDPQAQYFYARHFYYGWGVSESNRRAYRWFTTAAANGHPDAHYFIGEMYRHGYHRRQNVETAATYYRQAADLGSARGAFQYAYQLDNGTGVEKSPDTAYTYYQRAIELNPEHAQAHNNLGVVYEIKLRRELRNHQGEEDSERIVDLKEKMLNHLLRASELNNRLATRNLALTYFNGDLLPQDYRLALRYALAAADQGEPRSYFLLGQIYDEGLGVGRNVDEAAYYFRLAGLNDPDRANRRRALRRLCEYYTSGTSESIDITRASQWMLLLAHNGDWSMLGLYGDALLGMGRYKEAREHFTLLTQHFDLYLKGYGYRGLSKIYEQGLGVRPNKRRAERNFQRAVDSGFGKALYQHAMRHQRDGDEAGALTLFQESLEMRHLEAAYVLGQYYMAGRSVEKDPITAVRYFRQAATINHVNALYDLAVLTYMNTDGAPSVVEAIEFARRAEGLGHHRAGALREVLEKRLQLESSQESGSEGEAMN